MVGRGSGWSGSGDILGYGYDWRSDKSSGGREVRATRFVTTGSGCRFPQENRFFWPGSNPMIQVWWNFILLFILFIYDSIIFWTSHQLHTLKGTAVLIGWVVIPSFWEIALFFYGAVMIIKGGGSDKILHEMAPESRVHSHKSGRAGETLDVDAWISKSGDKNQCDEWLGDV